MTLNNNEIDKIINSNNIDDQLKVIERLRNDGYDNKAFIIACMIDIYHNSYKNNHFLFCLDLNYKKYGKKDIFFKDFYPSLYADYANKTWKKVRSNLLKYCILIVYKEWKNIIHIHDKNCIGDITKVIWAKFCNLAKSEKNNYNYFRESMYYLPEPTSRELDILKTKKRNDKKSYEMAETWIKNNPEYFDRKDGIHENDLIFLSPPKKRSSHKKWIICEKGGAWEAIKACSKLTYYHKNISIKVTYSFDKNNGIPPNEYIVDSQYGNHTIIKISNNNFSSKSNIYDVRGFYRYNNSYYMITNQKKMFYKTFPKKMQHFEKFNPRKEVEYFILRSFDPINITHVSIRKVSQLWNISKHVITEIMICDTSNDHGKKITDTITEMTTCMNHNWGWGAIKYVPSYSTIHGGSFKKYDNYIYNQIIVDEKNRKKDLEKQIIDIPEIIISLGKCKNMGKLTQEEFEKKRDRVFDLKKMYDDNDLTYNQFIQLISII